MEAKKIYITFVRHGTTIYNEQDRVQGTSDIPLSEKGINEIKNVALNKKFDCYYHSPLRRSKETLFDIMKYNKLYSSNILESNLITERGYGIFEGLTKKEIAEKHPAIYKNWLTNENVKAPFVESIENVILRIREFISKMINININMKNRNILAVTHSGFLCALYKYITNSHLGLKPHELDVTFPNCVIVDLQIHIIDYRVHLILIVNNKRFEKIINN